MSAPERFTWAVEIMDVQPTDRVLEIGCGHGIAAELVCECLTTGTITAIDRSEKMAELARSRNRGNIDSGKAVIETADLLTHPPPAARFDKIFLYNLNVFWMDPADELAAIKRLLAPSGKFYIFHRPPPGGDAREYAVEFEKNLTKYGLTVIETEFNDSPEVNSVCIISEYSSTIPR